MLETIYKWSKLVAVLCIIPITIFVCLFLNSLRHTTDTVAAVANNLPEQVDTRIGKLQDAVMEKIDTVQDKLDGRIEKLTGTSNDRIGAVEKDLFASVNGLSKNVNDQLTTANKSLNTLVVAYADVPKTLGDRYEHDFSSFFDCNRNRLCLQGQTSDTLFAIRTASRDTSDTMAGIKTTLPEIEAHTLTISNTFAHDIPIMTTNIAGITQNINTLTKPKWYDRILGYALNGAVLYRNLNPVTSITVAGAQLVSSQK